MTFNGPSLIPWVVQGKSTQLFETVNDIHTVIIFENFNTPAQCLVLIVSDGTYFIPLLIDPEAVKDRFGRKKTLAPYIIALDFRKINDRPVTLKSGIQDVSKNPKVKQWIQVIEGYQLPKEKPISSYFRNKEITQLFSPFDEIEYNLEKIMNACYIKDEWAVPQPINNFSDILNVDDNNEDHTLKVQEQVNMQNIANTQQSMNSQPLENTQQSVNSQPLENTQQSVNTQKLLNTQQSVDDTHQPVNSQPLGSTQQSVGSLSSEGMQQLVMSLSIDNSQPLENTEKSVNKQHPTKAKQSVDTPQSINVERSVKVEPSVDILNPVDVQKSVDVQQAVNSLQPVNAQQLANIQDDTNNAPQSQHENSMISSPVAFMEDIWKM
ncbi:hypothetical protein BD770DRAFT_441135 [Pilaira anomala]|nr:hypothetical protein BD770DRAFT_441135 [Pilaira anomala]